jgi:hypothetical protein
VQDCCYKRFVIGPATALAALLFCGNFCRGYSSMARGYGRPDFAGHSGISIRSVMKKIRIDSAQNASIVLTKIKGVIVFSAFPGFAFMFRKQPLG